MATIKPISVDGMLRYHQPVQQVEFATALNPSAAPPINIAPNKAYVPSSTAGNTPISFRIPPQAIDTIKSFLTMTVRVGVPFNVSADPGTAHTSPLDGIRPYFNHALESIYSIEVYDGQNYHETITHADVVARLQSAFPETEYLQTMRTSFPAISRASTFPTVSSSNTITHSPTETPTPYNSDKESYSTTEFGNWTVMRFPDGNYYKAYSVEVNIPLYEIHPIFATGQVFPGMIFGSSVPTITLNMNETRNFLSFELVSGTAPGNADPAIIFPADHTTGLNWYIHNPVINFRTISANDDHSRRYFKELKLRSEGYDPMGLPLGDPSDKDFTPGIPMHIENIQVVPKPIQAELTEFEIRTSIVQKSLRQLYFVFQSRNLQSCPKPGDVVPAYKVGYCHHTRSTLSPTAFRYVPLSKVNVTVAGITLTSDPTTTTPRLYSQFLDVMKKPGNLITGSNSDSHLGDFSSDTGFGIDHFVLAFDFTDPAMIVGSANSGLDTTEQKDLVITVTLGEGAKTVDCYVQQIAVYDETIYFYSNGSSGQIIKKTIKTPIRS